MVDNVVQFSNRGEEPDSMSHKDSGELINACQNIAARELGALLKRMFDNADDTLFEMADKAENNTIQTMYFDAMREVRIRRTQVEEEFNHNIRTSMNRYWTSPESVRDDISIEDTSLDDLTLVENEDLEESLAITNMIQKAQDRFMLDLYAIKKRLTHISGGMEINDSNNPFSPEIACHAIRDAMQPLDVELKIKLIIYKLFDKYVMANICNMYLEINTKFIDAGILPKIRMKISKTGMAPARHNHYTNPVTGEEGPTGRPGEYEAGIAPAQTNIIETLHELLAMSRGDSGRTVSAPGQLTSPANVPAVFATTHEISGILTSLQSIRFIPVAAMGNESAAPADIRERILGEVRSLIENEYGKSLSQLDEDIIDVICMLFEFILDDHNLSGAIKALIGRLQIPMLKVALNDKEFLSRKNHPARRLLNELARAGMGLNADSSPQNNALHANIEHIVDRVLNEFQHDTEIFTKILEDFLSFLDNMDSGAEEHAKEFVREAYQAREEQEFAKRWVQEMIESRIDGKDLPGDIKQLLTTAWHAVMLDTYTSEGLENLTWKEQTRFIDILLWSVEPKHTHDDREKLARAIPQLLNTLSRGLDRIGCPQEEKDARMRVLETCHLSSLHGGSMPVSPPVVNEIAESGAASEIDHAASNDGESDAKLEDMIGALEEEIAALDEMEVILDDLSNTKVEPEEIPPLDSRDATGFTSAQDHDAGGNMLEDIVLDNDGRAVITQDEEAIEDRFTNRARRMKPGTWVLFTHDNLRLRAKLIWKSDLLSEYTFVDWKYKVIAEKTLQGLAADLRRGTLTILENAPLVDRAMDAVVGVLNKNAHRQPSESRASL